MRRYREQKPYVFGFILALFCAFMFGLIIQGFYSDYVRCVAQIGVR